MNTNQPAEMANALVDQASHAADQVAKSTQQLAHNVSQGVRDSAHQLRVKAGYAGDDAVHYIRHEPVKAMLIAAATGAALMALVSLFSHSRGNR
ncbi:hypothetical protein [Rhodoferax sp.]|uniref:hypothetical protein n=1 Tax=Rhodoferax sp. TaxID=50421 RepID=UPI0019E69818|nr:hypothetical protein [Rhodoferax sp.]MBE0474371.1 hypothetical protein [Rhodoferax sp.]